MTGQTFAGPTVQSNVALETPTRVTDRKSAGPIVPSSVEFETPVKGPEQVLKLLPRPAGARPGVHDRTKEAMDASRPPAVNQGKRTTAPCGAFTADGADGLTEDQWRLSQLCAEAEALSGSPWRSVWPPQPHSTVPGVHSRTKEAMDASRPPTARPGQVKKLPLRNV